MENNMFILESKDTVERIVDDWKSTNKPVLSNFYGLTVGFEYDYFIASNSIVIRKHENDYYRLF